MKVTFRLLCFFLLSGSSMGLYSQQMRLSTGFNDGWRFAARGISYAETVLLNDDAWETVSLPHTWNAFDPFDDDKVYRRGISWYRNELNLDQRYLSKSVFLYFEGANQVAHVYVNGHFAGMHKGGYTGFSIDITRFLKWQNSNSTNTIAIQVNNAHDPFIIPLNVGYASYGGIYRHAWVIATNPLHFASINNNSGGVYMSTPSVTRESATILSKTRIRNDHRQDKNFEWVNVLYDAGGKEITTWKQSFMIRAGSEQEIMLQPVTINNPRLWSPENPYLYTTRSQLITDGKVVDEVTNKTGFRWFSFDSEKGFSLNGEKLVLRGTNRHQDMKGKGDALSWEDHRRDMKIIKDMGCNFLRLAHYPQTAAVLSLADELGLLIWEEVPLVNFITRDEEFLSNTKNMIREMITQGFNHPSIILWGSSNEILLHGPDGERLGKHADTAYLAVVRKYSQQLDSTIRAEDPSRYSTVAMHISNDYAQNQLDIIPQVAGYNIYSGWYSGKVEDLSDDLDQRKKKGHIVFISEYGAEGEVRLNTERPQRFDYTPQYQRYYHESYLRQFNERPWLGGTAIWNQFDFSQPNIGGPASHMNQKGLVTWDREIKDAYYLYKANWNPSPMVYIATRDWLYRSGTEKALSTIDVYANMKEVTLFVNGISQKSRPVNDLKRATWMVQLRNGDNVVMAVGKVNGKNVSDQVIVRYELKPTNLADPAYPFQSLHINSGSNAQYLDPTGVNWIDDQPWKEGSYGYLQGKPSTLDRKEMILQTDDEPLFYSYIDSLQSYRVDVPEGTYSVTLCFAEPLKLKAGERVFDVSINKEKAISNLDLAKSYGVAVAVKKTFLVKVEKNEPLVISFAASKRSAILNGLSIIRQ